MLAQIRKHVPAVVVIPGSGATKAIQFSGGEGRGGDGQCNRLVKPLLAGKTDPSLTSRIRMFVTITAPTLDAGPQRWILTAVWYQISNNHFTLFSHVHLDKETI
jgi:hypothetical protein